MVLAMLLDSTAPEHHQQVLDSLQEPWAPLRATWGTGPAARRAARVMMDLAGGPAPMRDPAKARPTPGGDGA